MADESTLTNTTFIDACVEGKASADDIEDWTERWHKGGGAELELIQFLGMSENEFDWYLRDSSILPYIIAGRKDGILAN